jgi:hypothetical protein
VRELQRLAIVVVVVAVSTARLDAQRRGSYAPLDPVRVGPHMGYNFDVSALVLGLQVTMPVTTEVELYPTFDYYFVSPAKLWALNFDVKLRPPTRRRALYVGGGLEYLHSSAGNATGGTASSGDINISLIGGWEVRRSPVAPYAEGRLLLGHGSAFQVAGGISFYLH